MSRTATSVRLPALRGAPTPEWIADMEQAIMRDKTLEARGFTNKIEMLAWDLGYEEMAGGDPRYYASQFKLVQALAAEQGLERVVNKEHKDGLQAGREQDSLRSAALRIASELPQGNPTRRKLLAVLKKAALPNSPSLSGVRHWTTAPKSGSRLHPLKVPFSELAMSTQMAGKRIDWYAISRDGRSAEVYHQEKDTLRGLTGEVLGDPQTIKKLLAESRHESLWEQGI